MICFVMSMCCALLIGMKPETKKILVFKTFM